MGHVTLAGMLMACASTVDRQMTSVLLSLTANYPRPVAIAGERAQIRFWEFFVSNIRSPTNAAPLASLPRHVNHRSAHLIICFTRGV